MIIFYSQIEAVFEIQTSDKLNDIKTSGTDGSNSGRGGSSGSGRITVEVASADTAGARQTCD